MIGIAEGRVVLCDVILSTVFFVGRGSVLGFVSNSGSVFRV